MDRFKLIVEAELIFFFFLEQMECIDNEPWLNYTELYSKFMNISRGVSFNCITYHGLSIQHAYLELSLQSIKNMIDMSERDEEKENIDCQNVEQACDATYYSNHTIIAIL